MVVRSLVKRAGIPVALVGAFVLFGAASCDETMPTVEAQLTAAPSVPERITRGRAHVVVHLEAVEKQFEVAPGVTYQAWTFNGLLPGPMIRVREGDEVEVHLKNSTNSVMTHNIDLHAVNGPGGGAGATTVAPGEEKSFTFKAKAPGLYVYHCAAGIVADHIANGLWGAILVDPVNGPDAVDHEYYVAQGEFYTIGDTGTKGQQDLDVNKLFLEEPTYVVFNGNTKALTGAGALKATTGQTVRLYVANGGPNLISSFHVIGEIFDKVYQYGSLTSSTLRDVQTVLVPPGGATVVEFKVDVPGDYKLVDHSVARLSKGAVGTLTVEGPDDFNTFDARAAGPGAASHEMGTPTATATAPASTTASATPSPSATGQAAAPGTITVDMVDNAFVPKDLTVPAGQKVTFALKNSGKVPHNMRVADATGNFEGANSVVSDPELVIAGKTGTLEWQAPASPGTVKFRCDVHPDQMTGTITVK
ncbi:MAG: nitrite reductase, copper-containing [Dehalococcoidia bacterium]|nr:nitrite reductase, copper-containing [Dehalococcoidia bacterium]